jgi:hypothetical protein
MSSTNMSYYAILRDLLACCQERLAPDGKVLMELSVSEAVQGLDGFVAWG